MAECIAADGSDPGAHVDPPDMHTAAECIIIDSRHGPWYVVFPSHPSAGISYEGPDPAVIEGPVLGTVVLI